MTLTFRQRPSIELESSVFAWAIVHQIDFQRLHAFMLSSAFFVVRAKEKILLQRRHSHPVDKTTGVLSDQAVVLATIGSVSTYPNSLRRVSYLDAVTGKRLVFLTNNFTLPVLTIAQIYKKRWQVELFFRWIKMHLRINATQDFHFFTPAATAVSITFPGFAIGINAWVNAHNRRSLSLRGNENFFEFDPLYRPATRGLHYGQELSSANRSNTFEQPPRRILCLQACGGPHISHTSDYGLSITHKLCADADAQLNIDKTS